VKEGSQMMISTRHLGGWLVALGLAVLPACAGKGTTGEESTGGGATVAAIEGTDLSSITLTDQAAERIGLEVDTVKKGAGSLETIPYSAVLYDPEGGTWTFTESGELTYVRAPITVDRIDGELAYLSAGPPVGTEIVTVGATELYGAEIGVGDE
jgi:hypothetical protein